MVKAIDKSHVFFSLDKAQTKEQEYQRFFHFCIFSQPEGIVMPFKIRELTPTEHGTPAALLPDHFAFSVEVNRAALQTDRDNLVFQVLLQVEEKGYLRASSEHPFAGITILCVGSHPQYAYAWSSAHPLPSPLDYPTAFMARIGMDNKQRLLDHAIDLSPKDRLEQALLETESAALSQRESERTSAHDLEKHRKSILPKGVEGEDASFIRRVKELGQAYETEHTRTETYTARVFILHKVLGRLAVPPEERISDYSLARQHDVLFKSDQPPPTPRP